MDNTTFGVPTRCCAEKTPTAVVRVETANNHQLLVHSEEVRRKIKRERRSNRSIAPHGHTDHSVACTSGHVQSGFKCEEKAVFDRTLLNTTSGVLVCNSLTCFTQSSSPSNDE